MADAKKTSSRKKAAQNESEPKKTPKKSAKKTAAKKAVKKATAGSSKKTTKAKKTAAGKASRTTETAAEGTLSVAGAAGRVARRRARRAGILPEDTKPLVPQEIEHFRELLLEKRREVLGDVDSMWNGALESNRQESSGDLSNMPIHMADVGTDNYEQEFTLDLVDSERRLLHDIDRALAKIAVGTYGYCEGTGKPIGRARLEAKPEARYTIEYARMLEKGLATPPSDDEVNERFDGILDDMDQSESA